MIILNYPINHFRILIQNIVLYNYIVYLCNCILNKFCFIKFGKKINVTLIEQVLCYIRLNEFLLMYIFIGRINASFYRLSFI